MKRPDIAVLCILLSGNALVWLPRLAEDYSRRFDFEGFHASVERIFEDQSLEPYRFDEEGLLPDDYAYYESAGEDRGLLSIYVGYYPRKGLLGGDPHDPAVCYPSAGWEVAEGPEVVRIGDPRGELFASRLLVRSQGHERIVLSWLQPGGEMPRVPDGRLSWTQELWSRLTLGRSDRAWVRLELDPDMVPFPLEPRWRDLVRNTMAAARESMK